MVTVRVRDARPAHHTRPSVEWSLAGFGGLIAVLAPLVILAVPQADVVAVIGPPGGSAADAARIVAEAGGTLLNRGGRDDVFLARSDRAGFAGRLYAAGASLVLDGRLSEGCGPSAPATPPPDPSADTARNSSP